MTDRDKHSYRVLGRSDLAFAGRNMLIDVGVKLATEAGDQLGTVWLQDNVFHHTLPSLMDPDHPRGSVLQRLIATGNTVYSNVWGSNSQFEKMNRQCNLTTWSKNTCNSNKS